MTFQQRLTFLGYTSYTAYLDGRHWTSFKATYAASDQPQHCLVCNNSAFQLHHTTYIRLGCEDVRDVMPLCFTHHTRLHEVLAKQKLPVEKSYEALAIVKGLFTGTIRSIPKRKKTKRRRFTPEERQKALKIMRRLGAHLCEMSGPRFEEIKRLARAEMGY